MGLRKNPCLFLLLLASSAAMAQKTTSYSGDHVNAKGETGTAQYTYYLDGERPVPHGKFRFSTTYEDSLRCNHHIFRTSNGEYAHGRKQGRWNYEYRELVVAVERMEGLRAFTRTDGTQGKTMLSYEKGVPSGNLSFTDEGISNGRVSGTLRKGEANFTGGRPTGSFSYDDREKSLTVKGMFDSRGNFDGEWVITRSDTTGTYLEERTYTNGFLLKLRLSHNDSVLQNLSYDDVIAKLQRLADGDTTRGYSIGPRAFGVEFDDGFTSDSPYERAQDEGNSIIMLAQQRLFGPDSEPYAYTGLDTMRQGSTRRFIYTYTQEEEEALQRSAVMLDTLRAISDRYLENRTLMMNRQKSDSLAFSYGWLMTLQSKLGQLEKAVQKLNSDDFRYQDRTNYYSGGIACAADVDSIRYDFDGEERVRAVVNEACVTDGKDVILNIDRFLKVLKEHLTATAGFLDGELKLLKREQQLTDTEERILALTDSVFVRYTGHTETDSDNGSNGDDGQASELHRAVFRNLMVQSRKRMMQDYSNLENYTEKQEKGLRILDLLNTLLDAHPRLEEVNGMPEKLDEAFTAFEYNPYMGRHDIKVRKKKRIYDRAMLDLWPHVLRQLDSEKDHARMASVLDETFRLYERLVEISKQPDSDTSKLERRLRSETDPERIKKLLDL